MREYNISSDNIKINGRSVCDSDAAYLFWSGSSIELNIKATELHIVLEGIYSIYEHFIAIEINGMITQRIMLDGNKQSLTVFRNFDDSVVTHVRIIKEVQAMSEDSYHVLKIYSIKTDGIIFPIKDKKYRFEFIGDSITSGEGAIGTLIEGTNEAPWSSYFFSHVHSYPYILSNKFNADYQVFSKSGWGIHCAWDNNPICELPIHYDNICSVMPDDRYSALGIFNKYDFSSRQPDVIIVNLGTNDNSAFFNPPFIDEDGNVFKMHYDENGYDNNQIDLIKNKIVKFLIKIRNYNQNAYIYWAFGMLGSGLSEYIKEAINEFNTTYNDRVIYIALPEAKGEEVGARLHPGYLSHKKCAEIIGDYISKDLLNTED